MFKSILTKLTGAPNPDQVNSPFDITKEKASVQKEIKKCCEDPRCGLPNANPDQFYQFVWVDKKVNEKENQIYVKSIRYLGYKAFETFSDLKTYMNFLNSNEIKNNIFVITGGPLTDQVINATYEFNQIDKKV